MAEAVGFEPTVPCGTSVFKTDALSRTRPRFLIYFGTGGRNRTHTKGFGDPCTTTIRHRYAFIYNLLCCHEEQTYIAKSISAVDNSHANIAFEYLFSCYISIDHCDY